MQWILFNITISNAPLVTVIYWAVLFPSISADAKGNAMDIMIHGANSSLILVELLVNAIPVRILHFYHPMLYAVCYLIFSTIYWAVDHSNVIYEYILDWNHPINTVIAAASILVYFVLIHFVFYWISRLKRFISK